MNTNKSFHSVEYGSISFGSSVFENLETYYSSAPEGPSLSPTESWFNLQGILNQILRLGRLDIIRLNKELEILKDEIIKIKNQVSSTQAQIKNLYGDELSLKKPLDIIIKEENGEFVASSLDLDTYGVGDSTQEAIKDLAENITDIYFTFKKEGEKNLGPVMLKIWHYMLEIIKEKEHATKNKRGT